MTGVGSIPTDELRRLLEKRAAVLAKPLLEKQTGDAIDLLVVWVGDERYGVDVRHILEVRQFEALTPIPGIPPVWAGLVNLRGILYPVVNGANYLGVQPDASDEHHVVVVASTRLVVGLDVDRVEGFRSVRMQDIEAPLGADAQAHRRAVSGVTPDLLLILDVDALLEDPMLVVDEAAS